MSAAATSVWSSRYDGHRFENHGLVGRRLGPGYYSFRMMSGRPGGRILSVMVSLLEPWAVESVPCAVPSCKRHGRSCPLYDDDDGDCKMTTILAEGPRWSSVFLLIADDALHVTLYRRPRVRTLEGAKRGRYVCRDAGFVVQAFVGVP
jgi:hypothetical protein